MGIRVNSSVLERRILSICVLLVLKFVPVICHQYLEALWRPV